ncbi:MAG: IS21-like element helper ATPase IstB [Alphaproteobacteria bacterium]|nr:IS21-like element helper ATPase IstB [Alphaproteobacteria bacterium]
MNEATIDKMLLMKFYGMARAFKETMGTGVKSNFTADELLGHLIDCEWENRQNRKLDRLLKTAKFRYQASFEQIDFTISRNLDKNMILRFSDCDYVSKKQNLIISGPTGVGKSFIACAIGQQACIRGYKVLYFNIRKLFSLLKISKADASYQKEISRIQKQDLIILDDFGLEHLDKQDRLSLLEIFEDRYGKRSSIITSQLPVQNWHEIIGDQTIADAICDRIIHNSHKIELKGGSVRKKYSKILTKTDHLK